MLDALIIGAGISGLTAALRLKKAGREVLLLDGVERPGGVMRTLATDGFIVELGPNSVRMTDDLEALVTELGLDDELLTASPKAPRYIYKSGTIHPAPMGLGPLLRTPLLSTRAKLRLLGEPFASRPKDGGEPSIEEFITRRLGREIHDVFVASFISGVYAGDTSRLSAAAVFPKLVEFERERGSIVRGAIAAMRGRKKNPGPRKKRRPMTIVSFKTGLARLPERLAEVLGESANLSSAVDSVERKDGHFAVHAGAAVYEAKELYVATPAHIAARLLGTVSPRAAELLTRIEYPPLASVSLAYEKSGIDHSCEGFGFLAPRTEDLRLLGGLFPGSLFPGRAPSGWHLITCFIGGATDPSVRDLDDETLVERVSADLGRAIGARGTPRVVSISRWERAIPQYTIGHTARIAEIERETGMIGIRMLGNYLTGLSVGDCIERANKTVNEAVYSAQ